MMDPFRNYDAWLTTDRLHDMQEAEYEALAAWAEEEGRDLEDPVTDLLFSYKQAEWSRAELEAEAEYYEYEMQACSTCGRPRHDHDSYLFDHEMMEA